MAKTFDFLGDTYTAPTSKAQTVRQWYELADPTEPQLYMIPEGVTFAQCWEILTATRFDECPEWYYNLDSVPRDMIYKAMRSLSA